MSFRQPLLGPTGAHWLDDPPVVSCKDSTRQHAVDDPRLSCKRQVGGSSHPASSQTAGQPHSRANLTVTSITAGGDECLAILAVQMPSSPPASTAPNRTRQRTWPPAGLQLVGSCLLPTTGIRDLNSVSSHALTSAARGKVTTTVSGWVGGSGATTRWLAVVVPAPSRNRRTTPFACTSVLVRNHTTLSRETRLPAAGSCTTTAAPGDLRISIVGRAPQPRRTHHHLGLGERLAKGVRDLNAVHGRGGGGRRDRDRGAGRRALGARRGADKPAR